MPEQFEDVHREYRDGAEFETEHDFNVRTGALVDDLVAAVRALVAGTLDPDNALQGCYVALAELDEEAGRGR